jgi:hypothetical protein
LTAGEITVDACAVGRGGIWFDRHELTAAYEETEEDLAKTRKAAHMLRFIWTSYYIPGEQDWGVF